MYLKEIRIKNILSFQDAAFPLGPYTVILGSNNSGKTNLLRILDMISKNESLEFFQLNKKHKLDPNEPSEITLTLVLDESETKMVFQSIFGQDEEIYQVSRDLRTLHIVIYWENKREVVVHPKFTLYQFDNGFTIATRHSDNVVFDRRKSILENDEEYNRIVDAWKTAESSIIFNQSLERFVVCKFGEVNNKAFMEAVLNGKRFTLECHIVRGLPMSVNNNPNTDTPIANLMRGRKNQNSYQKVSTSFILNAFFERSFTLIKEIDPTVEDLSNNLANLRNSQYAKYVELLNYFKEVSGGVEILVERDTEEREQILFVEDGKKYGINDSASGHYALASILLQLLKRNSGLVAIDEPEGHFHPAMSSRLHNWLEKRAHKTDVQTIVVTHSPKFVTYRQIQRMDGSRLIMLTRCDSVSRVSTDTKDSKPTIKPQLLNPEIFFGRCSMIVEGSGDYFVQKSISDFCNGLFEKHNIVIVNATGKCNIPAQSDLHDRFNIPYHCMVDSDYDGSLEHVTKLEEDLEAELVRLGVKRRNTKVDYHVYSEMIDFLNKPKGKEWEESGIYLALEAVIQKAGGTVPPMLHTDL